ncbi:tRNA pseudouridine(13) synthase TruD [Candidatus Desantisbacteria bacterium]|nr:tRNA pseudouridine(13) synthase TruD [Candidatus Desantisbacteria bacterium]
MHFKIKCIPDDFMVDEIANLPLKERGEYASYILKKKEWNTIELG